MLKIIFRARKSEGKDDLDALEMLIRTGMHKIGSRLLERFLNSEEFSKRLYAEAQRRGIQRAKEVCIIGDGAKWIWNIAEENYSYTGIFERAIQIIDPYHAREHYWDCVRAVYPSDRKKTNQVGRVSKKRIG